jgi:hypothetical protein
MVGELEGEDGEGFYVAQSGRPTDLLVYPGGWVFEARGAEAGEGDVVTDEDVLLPRPGGVGE